jgi:hypothetical protein
MFWMVLGSCEPSFRHDSLQSARNEAARLAKRHPGQEFTVLESVATCMAESVVWNELRFHQEAIYTGWSRLSAEDVFVKGDKVRLSSNSGMDVRRWTDLPDCWIGKRVGEAIAARSDAPF